MNSIKQSKLDKAKFECQKYQFFTLIDKYGIYQASIYMTPKRSGHYSKSQRFNADLISQINGIDNPIFIPKGLGFKPGENKMLLKKAIQNLKEVKEKNYGEI